jgi:hypothetical protein
MRRQRAFDGTCDRSPLGAASAPLQIPPPPLLLCPLFARTHVSAQLHGPNAPFLALARRLSAPQREENFCEHSPCLFWRPSAPAPGFRGRGPRALSAGGWQGPTNSTATPLPFISHTALCVPFCFLFPLLGLTSCTLAFARTAGWVVSLQVVAPGLSRLRLLAACRLFIYACPCPVCFPPSLWHLCGVPPARLLPHFLRRPSAIGGRNDAHSPFRLCVARLVRNLLVSIPSPL